jgi:carboxymethylenebutenolidase
VCAISRATAGSPPPERQEFEEKMMSIFRLLFASCIALIASPVFAQGIAQERLRESPRHHEWIDVATESGRKVRSFVVYPESGQRKLAVIVLHENRGLTDWVRAFADQLADAGYVAIAPDLLSQFDEHHARTGDFTSEDAAREAIYKLDDEQVMRDLKAVQRWVANTPASSGEVAIVGFCWGGTQSFRFATRAPQLAAVAVFYGTAPTEPGQLSNIEAPVYGFYGENDARVNGTLPDTEALMNKLRKRFEPEIYPGAGHAFMRAADDEAAPTPVIFARDKAFDRLRDVLAKADAATPTS